MIVTRCSALPRRRRRPARSPRRAKRSGRRSAPRRTIIARTWPPRGSSRRAGTMGRPANTCARRANGISPGTAAQPAIRSGATRSPRWRPPKQPIPLRPLRPAAIPLRSARRRAAIASPRFRRAHPSPRHRRPVRLRRRFGRTAMRRRSRLRHRPHPRRRGTCRRTVPLRPPAIRSSRALPRTCVGSRKATRRVRRSLPAFAIAPVKRG